MLKITKIFTSFKFGFKVGQYLHEGLEGGTRPFYVAITKAAFLEETVLRSRK